MSSTSGKAAIVLGNTALTEACPTAGMPIVDFVRYQAEATATTVCTEGFVATTTIPDPGTTISNGGGMKRLGEGCTDTNVNRDDFFAAFPSLLPRNTSDPLNVCAPPIDPNYGACTNIQPTGTCVVLTDAGCDTAGGIFQGECTNCPLPGACCTTAGVCLIAQEAVCLATPGQTYSGNGSDCINNPCVTGACCQSDGGCAIRTAAGCSGCYSGDNTTCGTPITMFAEDFDSVTVPALPDGWTATNAVGAGVLWVTSDSGGPAPSADTPPNAAFVDDPGSTMDKRLESPSILVPAGAILRFQHNRSFENLWDGGVLEISIEGGAFEDIITAGGTFVTGGYNAVINASANPLSGRQGWSGTSGGAYITTEVMLPTAAAGQNIILRWRMGSDGSVAGVGWRVDTIVIEVPTCPPIACGACCNNGACSVTTAAGCVGTFQPLGSSCPNPACGPVGACCVANTCSIQDSAGCANLGGVYSGSGTFCTAPAPCHVPCCKANGSCDLRTQASCNALPGAVAGAPGTACPPTPCAALGSCCAADGSCTGPITQAACNASGGVTWTAGQSCSPNMCRGRCCDAGGGCSVTFPPNTPGAQSCNAPSVFGALGTTCEAFTEYGNPNPATVAIPTGAPTTTTGTSDPSIINVPDSFNVADIDVSIKITHTWRNDLIICITGPDGTTVRMTTGTACEATGGFCGSDDNFNVIFDDEGAAINCPSPNLANLANPPDRVIPAEALAAFDGLPANGDWTLRIYDDAGGDVGTLVTWSLLLDTGLPCETGGCTCPGNVNGDGVVNGIDVHAFVQCVTAGGAGCQCGDFDNSGTANSSDVSAFVTTILDGATCN